VAGKPEAKRSLGRPKSKWEDNFEMDVKEWGGQAWTGFVWLRVRAGGQLLLTWQ
jgi:hypothetical protein